jgi:hypothetical protein
MDQSVKRKLSTSPDQGTEKCKRLRLPNRNPNNFRKKNSASSRREVPEKPVATKTTNKLKASVKTSKGATTTKTNRNRFTGKSTRDRYEIASSVYKKGIHQINDGAVLKI